MSQQMGVWASQSSGQCPREGQEGRTVGRDRQEFTLAGQ